jgi:hypothetical protein
VEDYYKSVSGDLTPRLNFKEIERLFDDETVVIWTEENLREVTEKRYSVDPKHRAQTRRMPSLLGLATVTVYGYDRIMYGWHTGTYRTVSMPYTDHLPGLTVR